MFFTIIGIPLLIMAVAEFKGSDIHTAMRNVLCMFFTFPANMLIFLIFTGLSAILFVYLLPMFCVWHDQIHERKSTQQCKDQALRRINKLPVVLMFATIAGFMIGRFAELHFQADSLIMDKRGLFFLGFFQSIANGFFASVLMIMSLSDLLFPVKRALIQQGTSVAIKQDSFVRKIFRSLFAMVFFLLMQMSLITFDFMVIGRDMLSDGDYSVSEESEAHDEQDSRNRDSLFQRMHDRFDFTFAVKKGLSKEIEPEHFFRHEKIRDSFKVLMLRFILYLLLAYRLLSLLKREMKNPIAIVNEKLSLLSDERMTSAQDMEKNICGIAGASDAEEIEIVSNDEYSEIFKSINILLAKRREEIQLNQDRLRKIIDSAADPILSFDNNGRIFIFNPAAELYFGIQRSDAGEIALRNLFSADEIEKCGCGGDERAFVEYLLNEKNKRGRFSGKGRGKTLNFEANISTTMTPEGPIHTAILRDIDAQLEFEDNLKRSKIEAERANRLKSEFLANMSHELRTPLNAVLGFTQLLVNDGNLTGDQKDKIRIIERSGEHLLGLINDILDISKIEAGKAELHLTTFNLPQFMGDINEMFALRCEKKGLSLDMELLDGIPDYVEGDMGKLRQILINLIGNAVKFTEEGGISIVAGPDPAGIRFAVSDTGIGIPENELDSILEPFVQSADSINEGGTGLGLAISSRFIRMMGGELKITSRPGNGSSFSFILAFNEVAAPQKNEGASKRIIGIAGGSRYKVLVVDDKFNNRLILKEMLERAGFIVQEAADGKEAVSVALDFRPQLVFMDIRMPVMDGYEAASAIRADERIRDCKIFALTASAFKHDEKRIIEAGFDGFLAKPFKMNTLFGLIAEKSDIIFRYEEQTVSARDKTDLEADYRSAAGEIDEQTVKLLRDALEINDFAAIRKILASTAYSGEAKIFSKSVIEAAGLFDEKRIEMMLDKLQAARG